MSMPRMRNHLLILLVVSGFFVGLSFIVANANTIGWDQLSLGWHILYYIEAILFAIQILIILFCRGNNPFNQKVLIVGTVIFLYKMAFDPYLMMFMFFKDRGVYDSYAIVVYIILILGFLLHIFVLLKLINGLKKNNADSFEKTKRSKFRIWLPVLFFLVLLSGLLIKTGLLGDFELMFGVILVTVIYLATLIGVCEFIIAAYCIFRFPSFSVNAPPKQQYVNKKKRRKRKK
ncbi:hypothetical protein HV433_17395 [Bacillus sporothermodurans]|nr:hypothetical protein [Heyndrickxia sporothermodurans]MBL5794250.1 hypothetical protein [Heyndrickxia sporothermodurans]MBL5805226.1 hypothetical protein [Heyndrickxia sporothermodurans]MBL5808941.1 hypothetical protein [Heyndrickxia sporothermodurans]MBL5855212.1 hypothetical protein [Heyndrickxia sporothermodurans]MBL5858849.1 hypothetical protein [Heyndrickxia sporothermodurans]